MTDITPPPELVQEWIGDYYGCPVSGELAGVETAIANRAAQWGADQELEACIAWFDKYIPGYELVADRLRAARRHKPPSLKEQALEDLDSLIADLANHGMGFNATNIRRALEQLDD